MEESTKTERISELGEMGMQLVGNDYKMLVTDISIRYRPVDMKIINVSYMHRVDGIKTPYKVFDTGSINDIPGMMKYLEKWADTNVMNKDNFNNALTSLMDKIKNTS